MSNWRKDLFGLRHCRRLKTEFAALEIFKFIDEAFSDCGGGGREKRFYHTAADTVDLIASEYGWDLEYIFDQPVRRAAQFAKAIVKRHNPKAVLFNRSERIIVDWQRQQKQANQ